MPEDRRSTIFVVALAIANFIIVAAWWWPLLVGYGIIGGDTYTYFIPLKSWYAERLQHGELALWNPLIGQGMPALGESQTAVFYPFNVILYGLLSVDKAYSASLLIHYWIGGFFFGLYLKRLNIGVVGCLTGSVVLVFGWFAPRSCLEWAMVTGCWMPVILWSVESFVLRRQARFLLCLSLAVAMQLLAGHFHLAFVSALIGAVYVVLRITLADASDDEQWTRRNRFWAISSILSAVVLGYLVASVQLVPSMELKRHSQRSSEFQAHDLNYGSVPTWYLKQLVAPAWHFYPRVWSGQLQREFGAANSNRVEAHLYFGYVTMLIGVIGLMARRREIVTWVWVVIGGCGFGLITGWWVDSMGWLPGLGYFTGPGRYGLMSQVAMAVLCAMGVEIIWNARTGTRSVRILLLALVGFQVWDYRFAAGFSGKIAAGSVGIARYIKPAPADLQSRSQLRNLLGQEHRVVSKNQNAMTLTGAAMYPVYLGIGPVEYFRESTMLPPQFQWDQPLSPEVHHWLIKSGVTHVIGFEEHPNWPLELKWFGVDAMFHHMLGRPASEDLMLYTLDGSVGRCFGVRTGQDMNDQKTAVPSNAVTGILDAIEVRGNSVELQVTLQEELLVVLTDLSFPGWEVEVDGDLSQPLVWNKMSRAVRVPAGQHLVVWRYWPASLTIGIAMTLCGVLLLTCLVWRIGS